MRRSKAMGRNSMNALSGDFSAPKDFDNSDCTIHVAHNEQDFVALKQQWLSLESTARGATFFQSFEWCRNAVEHRREDGDLHLFICCIFARDTLIGLLPLAFWKKGLRTVLTGLAEPFQQYTEMLAAPGYSPKALFRMMHGEIQRSGADYLHLGQVRQSGPLHSAIQGLVSATGEPEGAPYVQLRDWHNYEDYSKTLDPKKHEAIRNTRARLQEHGSLDHQSASGGDLLKTVIDRTCAGRAEWLSRMGLTSGVFEAARFEAFLNRFKTPEKSGVNALALSMTQCGRPIAEQWGFIHNGHYYAFMSAWDRAHEDTRPEALHLGDVLKTCYGYDLTTVDFITPATSDKRAWATDVQLVQDHVLALSPLGNLYCGLWDYGWDFCDRWPIGSCAQCRNLPASSPPIGRIPLLFRTVEITRSTADIPVPRR